MSWTEERIEALRGYLSENGVSFAQATASLNEQFGTAYSRSAVIGKADREKIPSRNSAHVHGIVKKAQPARPRPHRRRRDPRPQIMAETVVLRSVEVKPLHISFAELTDAKCKWPYGDAAPFTYCGNPACFGSYCGAHDLLSKRTRE